MIPAPDPATDPFPELGQNQICLKTQIKEKFTHHLEVFRIGLLYCFHKLLM